MQNLSLAIERFADARTLIVKPQTQVSLVECPMILEKNRSGTDDG